MLRTNHFRARRKHPFIKLAYTLQARLPLNFYISELTKKMRMRLIKLAYTLQARLPLNFYISELTKKMRMRLVLRQ